MPRRMIFDKKRVMQILKSGYREDSCPNEEFLDEVAYQVQMNWNERATGSYSEYVEELIEQILPSMNFSEDEFDTN